MKWQVFILETLLFSPFPESPGLARTKRSSALNRSRAGSSNSVAGAECHGSKLSEILTPKIQTAFYLHRLALGLPQREKTELGHLRLQTEEKLEP